MKDEGKSASMAGTGNARVDNTVQRNASISQNNVAESRNNIRDTVEECLGDIWRRKNLIVYNLRKDMDDIELVSSMFRVLGCEHSVQEIENRPTRIGSQGHRARPVKIELKSERAV